MKWYEKYYAVTLIIGLAGLIVLFISIGFFPSVLQKFWLDEYNKYWLILGIGAMSTGFFIELLVLAFVFMTAQTRLIVIASKQISILQEKTKNQKNGNRRELALSLTYLDSTILGITRSKIALLITTICILASSFLMRSESLIYTAFVPLTLYLLLSLKEIILQYRIENGIFGNNPYEINAMIDFLLENSKEIDFTDGSGKLKPAFLTESIYGANENGMAGKGAQI